MIGFTLSKINLLILVTALFAVIGYFTFGFSDMVLKIEANKTSDIYIEEIKLHVDSPGLCSKNTVSLPHHLEYLGKRYWYVMKIGRRTPLSAGDYSSVILSISPRGKHDETIASSRINVFSDIVLFKIEDGLIEKTDDEFILVDPQAKIPTNALHIVKEVYKGEDILYIGVCESGQCGPRFQEMARIVLCERLDELGIPLSCPPWPASLPDPVIEQLNTLSPCFRIEGEATYTS